MQNVNPMTNHVNSLIGWNNYLRENFYTLGIKKKRWYNNNNNNNRVGF